MPIVKRVLVYFECPECGKKRCFWWPLSLPDIAVPCVHYPNVVDCGRSLTSEEELMPETYRRVICHVYTVHNRQFNFSVRVATNVREQVKALAQLATQCSTLFGWEEVPAYILKSMEKGWNSLGGLEEWDV